MKQTAVEWLVKQLNINGTVIPMAIEYKAKEMEKQQVIDAWKDGAYGGGQFTTTFDNEEQYYNKTFKSE